MSDPRPTLQDTLAAHRAGRLEEARRLLQQLLDARPDFAEAWNHLGLVIDEAGDGQAAMECWRKAIALRPDYAEPHNNLALVLDRNGDSAGAIAAWKEAARLRPDWIEPQYYLASANEGAAPASAPARYVTRLFDKYAHEFDRHLLRQLEYKVPDLIAQAIERAGMQHADEVIDLGCGTGLSGLAVRSLAGRMVGVDLSPKMIEKARERNIYDELVAGDLMDVLKERQCDVDLILAADVFVYVGELSEVFAAINSALRPGGVLAFSVETTRDNEGDLVLRESRRFSHSRSYIEGLVEKTGLELIDLTDAILRVDGRDIIEGMIVVVRKR
jgi:predicted TPR repeat methyltransferase